MDGEESVSDARSGTTAPVISYHRHPRLTLGRLSNLIYGLIDLFLWFYSTSRLACREGRTVEAPRARLPTLRGGQASAVTRRANVQGP